MQGGQIINMKSKLLLIAFMISGITALIYEIVWARHLQLIFGSTIYAVSTILTIFLAGFAIGSYAFRNIADQSKNPALIFAALEAGIGLYGLIVFYLFNIISNIYVSTSNSFILQLILCAAALISPAILFGATWPLITKAYASQEKLGKDIANLYSFNSFGCFIGSIASGFILIPLFGLKTTSLIASALNIIIAFTIFAYFKKGGKNES